MMSLGPFSIHVVLVAVGAIVAWLTARWLQRGQPHKTSSLMLDALALGLLVARLAYVLLWWPEYFAAPLSIVSIGDGGFLWWAGLPVAIAWVLWKTHTQPAAKKSAFIALTAGMLVWAAGNGTLTLLQRAAQPLPDLNLSTLDQRPVALRSFAGQPLVVNLWASWCPPCRREMPVLAQGEAAFPGVKFLLINQGEDATTVTAFLQQQGLQFGHVLLDTTSLSMKSLGAKGLPSTLFFDAEGRLVDAHMGELTAARLKDSVKNRLRYSASAASLTSAPSTPATSLHNKD